MSETKRHRRGSLSNTPVGSTTPILPRDQVNFAAVIAASGEK